MRSVCLECKKETHKTSARQNKDSSRNRTKDSSATLMSRHQSLTGVGKRESRRDASAHFGSRNGGRLVVSLLAWTVWLVSLFILLQDASFYQVELEKQGGKGEMRSKPALFVAGPILVPSPLSDPSAHQFASTEPSSLVDASPAASMKERKEVTRLTVVSLPPSRLPHAPSRIPSPSHFSAFSTGWKFVSGFVTSHHPFFLISIILHILSASFLVLHVIVWSVNSIRGHSANSRTRGRHEKDDLPSAPSPPSLSSIGSKNVTHMYGRDNWDSISVQEEAEADSAQVIASLGLGHLPSTPTPETTYYDDLEDDMLNWLKRKGSGEDSAQHLSSTCRMLHQLRSYLKRTFSCHSASQDVKWRVTRRSGVFTCCCRRRTSDATCSVSDDKVGLLEEEYEVLRNEDGILIAVAQHHLPLHPNSSFLASSSLNNAMSSEISNSLRSDLERGDEAKKTNSTERTVVFDSAGRTSSLLSPPTPSYPQTILAQTDGITVPQMTIKEDASYSSFFSQSSSPLSPSSHNSYLPTFSDRSIEGLGRGRHPTAIAFLATPPSHPSASSATSSINIPHWTGGHSNMNTETPTFREHPTGESSTNFQNGQPVSTDPYDRYHNPDLLQKWTSHSMKERGREAYASLVSSLPTSHSSAPESARNLSYFGGGMILPSDDGEGEGTNEHYEVVREGKLSSFAPIHPSMSRNSHSGSTSCMDCHPLPSEEKMDPTFLFHPSSSSSSFGCDDASSHDTNSPPSVRLWKRNPTEDDLNEDEMIPEGHPLASNPSNPSPTSLPFHCNSPNGHEMNDTIIPSCPPSTRLFKNVPDASHTEPPRCFFPSCFQSGHFGTMICCGAKGEGCCERFSLHETRLAPVGVHSRIGFEGETVIGIDGLETRHASEQDKQHFSSDPKFCFPKRCCRSKRDLIQISAIVSNSVMVISTLIFHGWVRKLSDWPSLLSSFLLLSSLLSLLFSLLLLLYLTAADDNSSIRIEDNEMDDNGNKTGLAPEKNITNRNNGDSINEMHISETSQEDKYQRQGPHHDLVFPSPCHPMPHHRHFCADHHSFDHLLHTGTEEVHSLSPPLLSSSSSSSSSPSSLGYSSSASSSGTEGNLHCKSASETQSSPPYFYRSSHFQPPTLSTENSEYVQDFPYY